MKNFLRLAVATVLLSSGLAVGLSSPAQAASTCYLTGGLACYYDGTNYGGNRGVIPDANFSGPCRLNIFSFTTASSLANNSISTQTWHRNQDYTGTALSVARQSDVPSLSTGLNNNVRSWNGTCYAGARVAAGAAGTAPSAQPSSQPG